MLNIEYLIDTIHDNYETNSTNETAFFLPRCIYSAHTVNLTWTGYVPPMQLQDNNRPINWHAPIHNRFLWPKRNATSFPKR